jgi:hypothetical protein
MPFLHDQRGIIINWLLKLLLVLSIIGVIVFDTGSVVVNHFTLDSAANDAAIALSLAIETDEFGTNDAQVVEAAKTLIASDQTLAGDARVVARRTHVDEEGVIHVTLRRTANTLVVQRVEAIRKWGIATTEGTASTN